MPKFTVDIQDASGTVLGSGPITSVKTWEVTAVLNGAGSCMFVMPANDPKAALVLNERIAVAYAIRGGVRVEVGAMVIREIVYSNSVGGMLMEVRGPDRLGLLANVTTGNLTIDDGSDGRVKTCPQTLIALASGWSLDTTNGYDLTNKSIKHNYGFTETVLAAFIRLSDLTGENFRLGSGKKVVWLQNDEPQSGLRVVGRGSLSVGAGNTDIALIAPDTFRDVSDTHDNRVGRLYARGIGIGEDAVTLEGTTEIAPSGWSLGSDTKGYYLQHDSTWSTYGIERAMSFNDADETDEVYQLGYEWMLNHINPNETYEFELLNLEMAVEVGTQVRVVFRRYQDGVAVLSIDQDMLVVETTLRMENGVVKTTYMRVSNVAKSRRDGHSMIMDGLRHSIQTQTHNQIIGASSVVLSSTDLSNVITGSTSYTIPAMDYDATVSQTLTVTGAEVGDYVIVSHDGIGTADVIMSGQVSSADTVNVVFLNRVSSNLITESSVDILTESGDTILTEQLSSALAGTLRAMVFT